MLIDFLENAHKFIKRTKNSSPSDYNLTRESLISLSAYLCLLYLASDHFTGFTNSNPTTPYQEKIGSFSFFSRKFVETEKKKQTDDPFWPPKEQRKTRTERRQHTGDVLSICKANTHLQIYTNAFSCF